MKRPSFQFYPGDWRKDVELRSCSLAARALWIDLICVMHECTPYGHLEINGRPMTVDQIVGQTGIPAAQVRRLLDELVSKGVARKAESGSIYSKRMVDDERVRMARAEGGKAGSEYGPLGAEHGRKGGRPPKSKGGFLPPTEPPNKPPPSSSTSSSTSDESANALSARGAVGMALKAGGIDPTTINLSDPRVDSATAAGALPEHWEGLAREAVRSGKSLPFAWVVAVMPERLRQAAGTRPRIAAVNGSFTGKNYREGVEEDGTFAA